MRVRAPRQALHVVSRHRPDRRSAATLSRDIVRIVGQPRNSRVLNTCPSVSIDGMAALLFRTPKSLSPAATMVSFSQRSQSSPRRNCRIFADDGHDRSRPLCACEDLPRENRGLAVVIAHGYSCACFKDHNPRRSLKPFKVLDQGRALGKLGKRNLQAWPQSAHQQLDVYAPCTYRRADGWTSKPQHFLARSRS
jgi:hypothetical protein